jgi:hypothetical protein
MDIEQGKTIVKILEKRCGIPTTIYLDDGQVLLVNNIAWGYDMGDEFAHITTNISPGQDEVEIHFFYVNDVVKIEDTESGQLVYET